MAQRVRSVYFKDDYVKNWETSQRLHNSVFHYLAIHRPPGYLLPNLRKLVWSCHRDEAIEFCQIFLSPTLTRLELKFTHRNASIETSQFILRTASAICPSIDYLIFESRIPAPQMEVAVSNCIESLKCLKQVHLAPFYHTDLIVQTMGCHPTLQAIRRALRDGVSLPVSEDCARFKFQEGWFSRLETLRVDAKLTSIIDMLQNPHRPPKLTSLGWSAMREPIDNSELRSLFSAIANAYPEIQSLNIDMFHTASSLSSSNTSDIKSENPTSGLASQQISFEDIRPLLSCQKIHTFFIGHNNPLIITPDDIALITESWTYLEYIGLNEDPVVTPTLAPGLPLSVLALFTKLSRLKMIYLYVDPSTASDYLRAHSTGLPKLNNVTEICFGTSPVEDVFQMAKIIQEMCKETVKICYGAYNWHTSAMGMSKKQASNERNQDWREVRKLVGLLWQYSSRRSKIHQQLLEKEKEAYESARLRVTELEDALSSPK
ncbi:hypothetical protein FRC03_005429 [Tulasnella sp. 419]|nr:hypothetical protein FRC03_005429 [Tulasnella sp. 419]